MKDIQTSVSNDYDYNVWYKTNDPNFVNISRASRIPDKWMNYNIIRNGKYADSFIKPINPYVEELVPPPTLVSIDQNIVRLRQGNHAEFFLLREPSGDLRHIDRPWMRQYYNTIFRPNVPSDCFKETFKFYMPWYVDANLKIEYVQPDSETPFFVYPVSVEHKEIDKDSNYIEPDFIAFNFKSVGPHMEDKDFGKIKRQSPMFDIVFEADGIMLERVRKFYEKD